MLSVTFGSGDVGGFGGGAANSSLSSPEARSLTHKVALRLVIRSEPIFDIGQVFSGWRRNRVADGELKRKLLLNLWIGIGDDEIRVKLRERLTFFNRVVQEEVAPVRQLAEKLALNVFWMDVPVQLQSASLWRDAAEIGAVFGKEVNSGVACGRGIFIF